MRIRAIKDWCVCSLWLTAAGLIFFVALVPAESAPGEPDHASLVLRLVPDDPLPGQTVRVRIGVMEEDHAPRIPGWRRHKRIAVDYGMLSAVSCGSRARPERVSGQVLEGELFCIEWTLPAEPATARIEAMVEGLAANASVCTTSNGL